MRGVHPAVNLMLLHGAPLDVWGGWMGLGGVPSQFVWWHLLSEDTSLLLQLIRGDKATGVFLVCFNFALEDSGSGSSLVRW